MSNLIQYAFIPMVLTCCIWIFILNNRSLFADLWEIALALTIGLTCLSVFFPLRYSVGTLPECPLFLSKLLVVLTVVFRLFVSVCLSYGVALFTDGRKEKKVFYSVIPPCLISLVLLLIGMFIPSFFRFSEDRMTVFGWGLLIPMISFLVFYCSLISSFIRYIMEKHYRTAFVISAILLLMTVSAVLEIVLNVAIVFDFILLSSVLILLFDVHCVRSCRDPLTGCIMRRYFYYQKHSKRGKNFLYITVDLNGLKEINDRFGHNEGDKAIVSVVTELYSTFGNIGGRLYRMGGDEFAVILPVLSERTLHLYLKEAEENIEKRGYSCAMGYAYSRTNETIDQTMNRADKNMYFVKSQMKSSKK